MRNCCYQTNKVNSLGIEVCTCSFALYGIQMFSSVDGLQDEGFGGQRFGAVDLLASKVPAQVGVSESQLA